MRSRVLLLLGLVLVWLSAAGCGNPWTTRELVLRLEPINVPPAYLASNVVPANVTVWVTAPLEELQRLESNGVVAAVDVQGAQEEGGEERMFTVSRPVQAEVRLSSARVETVPESVSVTWERWNASR